MKKLVIYLVAEPETPELARAAVEGGADLVELGFPFSDPLAEGPVIRRASERALARGMRTNACLDVLVTKSRRALERHPSRCLVVVGGVAASPQIRAAAQQSRMDDQGATLDGTDIRIG